MTGMFCRIVAYFKFCRERAFQSVFLMEWLMLHILNLCQCFEFGTQHVYAVFAFRTGSYICGWAAVLFDTA